MDHDEMLLQLQETADRSLRNEGRIRKLENERNALWELSTSVSNLATRQGILEGDVKEIKTDVKVLAGKSGKRWDAMADKALWAVLAGAYGFIRKEYQP